MVVCTLTMMCGSGWQAIAMHIVVIVLLVILCLGLGLTTPCSNAAIIRMRVALIAIATWSTFCALGLVVPFWSDMDEPLGVGAAIIIVCWAVNAVRAALSQRVCCSAEGLRRGASFGPLAVAGVCVCSWEGG